MTTYPVLQRQVGEIAVQVEGVIEFLDAIQATELADRLRVAQHIVEEASRTIAQGLTTS